MSSPTSSALGLVSANIKLFNSKSDNDSTTAPPTTTATTTNNDTIILPPLPPKPVKIKRLSSSNSTSNKPNLTYATSPSPPPPPPPASPPLLIGGPPPPLPTTPPRPLNRPNASKTSYKKSQASPIVAQKSGSSTLKVMLGKVVGSVSGMFFFGLKKKIEPSISLLTSFF